MCVCVCEASVYVLCMCVRRYLMVEHIEVCRESLPVRRRVCVVCRSTGSRGRGPGQEWCQPRGQALEHKLGEHVRNIHMQEVMLIKIMLIT